MALTRPQLEQNIESLESQGASQIEIQEYLDSQSVDRPSTSFPMMDKEEPKKSGLIRKAGGLAATGAKKVGGFIAEELLPTFKDLGQAISLRMDKKANQETLDNFTAQADALRESIASGRIDKKRAKQLQEMLLETAPDFIKDNPLFEKSAREIFARAATTAISLTSFRGGFNALSKSALAGTKAVVAKTGIDVAKRSTLKTLGKTAIKSATLGGVPVAGFSAATALEEGKTGREIAREAKVGFLVGTVFATVGQAFKAFRGILAKRPENIIQRSLNTPSKYIRHDIFSNTKTINKKIIEEGYRGTARQVKIQSEQNLSKVGAQIGVVLKNAKHKAPILKHQVIKDIGPLLDDPFNEEFSRPIRKILGKLPGKMTPEVANKWKIKFASMVPDAFWNNPDAKISFKGELFEALSGSLRRRIEQSVGGGTIKALNSKWQSAHLVKLITSEEIFRVSQKGLLAGGGVAAGFLWGFVQNIFDLTIRSSTVGTRSAAFNTLLFGDSSPVVKSFSAMAPAARTVMVKLFAELSSKLKL